LRNYIDDEEIYQNLTPRIEKVEVSSRKSFESFGETKIPSPEGREIQEPVKIAPLVLPNLASSQSQCSFEELDLHHSSHRVLLPKELKMIPPSIKNLHKVSTKKLLKVSKTSRILSTEIVSDDPIHQQSLMTLNMLAYHG